MKYYHIFLNSGQELIVGAEVESAKFIIEKSNDNTWIEVGKLFQIMNAMSPQGVVKIKSLIDTKENHFSLRTSSISVIREVEKDEEKELNGEDEDKPNILIPRR